MAKILNKQNLFEILSLRFAKQEKKLSDIPSPELLLDSKKAASKIANAIKNNKKITLIGDYDVDGVSSTAIMVEFFKKIPYPLHAIIPNRFKDGYGISPNILKRVESDLIITVDNGISAIEAAKICKERGIDLIITDHHTPGEILPDAYAIVNPKQKNCPYPFKEICGAQVAWLLLGLLKKELSLNIDMREFLDILSIAIIADIMPLIDINRKLVIEGLKQLQISKRPSSIIIRDFLNKNIITSEDIGFQIAPRINAAGRLEDAEIALGFFVATDTGTAYRYFEKLNNLNELRKDTEAQITKEAVECVDENDKVIVVASQNWHEGVVGIVASRLVNYFEKPAIVLSIDDKDAKGSARSIGDVDIFELINTNKEFLQKFGGHKMAAGLGLDVKNIEKFKNAINQTALKIDESAFRQKDESLGMLPSDEIDFELLNLLDSFEPYGEANQRPLFLIENADILEVKLFGRDKNHSKIIIRQFPHERKTLELILFKEVYEIPHNRKLTCNYRVVKNEFNNSVSIQLIINKIYT